MLLVGEAMTSEYPPDWVEIAQKVKDEAEWKCERCDHPHDPKAGYCLTVHHQDSNPANCDRENLIALCQRCHMVHVGRKARYGPEDERQTRFI